MKRNLILILALSSILSTNAMASGDHGMDTQNPSVMKVNPISSFFSAALTWLGFTTNGSGDHGMDTQNP